MASAFETGIRSLDEMLGGKGIHEGLIVLVRGGPGTGKTTLTMQMLENHLQRQGKAALISLESPPLEVLRRARRHFFDALPTEEDSRLQVLDRRKFEDSFFRHDLNARQLQENLKEWLAPSLSHSGDSDKSLPPIVIIDSLSVLVEIAGSSDSDKRTLVHTVCKVIQDLVAPAADRGKPRPIVILTAEHHPDAGSHGSLLSESFMCDTEILLTVEELPRRGQGRSGERGESRSFCRVTKSRSEKNQTRRCCYEIVEKRGLVFYDTYPGDGRLLLFHENEPQRLAVQEFFELDVPQLFPSLQCEEFSRANLHHILDNQRRFHQIPERTDMSLASFDTYWINWYVGLSQRIAIAKFLKPRVPSFDPALVGFVHRYALDPERPRGPALLDAARGRSIANLPSEQELERTLVGATELVHSDGGQCGIFEILSWDRLRLFGSRRSDILQELAGGPHELRPAKTAIAKLASGSRTTSRRSEPPPATEPACRYRSLPYNFNVSFFVCRLDRLREISAELDRQELHRIERDICEHRRRWTGGSPDSVDRDWQMIDGVRTLRETDSKCLSWTWEEVIALCQLSGSELLIETQLFDTFLVSMLELLWAHGGSLCILPDYEIVYWEKTRVGLLQAFGLLDYMFEKRIARAHPTRSLSQYEDSKDGSWLFARHWYSTLVDLLTARTAPTSSEPARWLWDPEGKAELQIVPIPTTGPGRAAQLEQEKGRPSSEIPPRHHGCLGEWHLALLKGSENKELGYDIINWLVGSQSIGEQAASSAMLPTAEYFYKIYGDARCIKIPERPAKCVPSSTFAEIRSLGVGAMTRSTIFDYRRTMRELHGILEAIRARRLTSDQAKVLLEDAHGRIEKLGANEPPPG